MQDVANAPVNGAVRITAPLILGAVCKTWRQISWSTPQLWTTVSLGVDLDHFPYCSEILQEWLDRSGSLPLSIHLYTHTSSLKVVKGKRVEVGISIPPIEIINQYSGRWHHLSLAMPGVLLSKFCGNKSQGAPILLKLRVCQTENYLPAVHQHPYVPGEFALGDGTLPSPSIVEVSSFRLGALKVTWNNLTQFQGSELTIAECLRIVRCASRLRYCQLSFSWPYLMGEDPYMLHEPLHAPTVNPSLQHLAFTMSTDIDFLFLDLFFSRLTLPALQHLHLKNTVGMLSAGNFIGFLERSSCPLKTLSVENAQWDYEQLVRLLRTTLSLESLELILF